MKQAGTESRMDLDFKLPDTGNYRFQIEEGIKCETNKNSGKTSLWVPMKTIECLSGESEDNLDLQVTQFVPITSEFGHKQIAHILAITGLFEAFDKKFPGEDVDMSGEDFVNALKLKLPGKVVDGGVETKENKDGKRQANFKYIEKMGSGKKAAGGKGKKATATTAPDKDANEPPAAKAKDSSNDDW